MWVFGRVSAAEIRKRIAHYDEPGHETELRIELPLGSGNHGALRAVSFGRLEIEVTVDDPKVYTKPWTVKISQMLQHNTDLIGFICAEKGQTTPGAAVKEVVK